MPPYDEITTDGRRYPIFSSAATYEPVQIYYGDDPLNYYVSLNDATIDGLFKNEYFLAKLRQFVAEEQKKVHLDDETLDNIWDRLIKTDGRRAD